jgi:uncharacterized membrane protein
MALSPVGVMQGWGRYRVPAMRFSLIHFARAHRRLIVGAALGCLAAALVPATQRTSTVFLVGWNVGVWSYLLLMAWLMLRARPAHVHAIAQREDPGALAVLVVLSITAVASLLAIVIELVAVRELPPAERLLHYAGTASTVFGSWLLVNTLFTFHYANLYYRAPAGAAPLQFPGKETAMDYRDFLYFSFTIAVAAQTSDVTVLTSSMRRMVLAQSVLSFLFNAAIIGLSINVAAGLLGS